MLAPDVVNFQSNCGQETTFRSGTLTENKLEAELKSQLEALGNIFQLKIILPNSVLSDTADNIKKVLTEDTEYYVVEKGFDMSVIFDKTFHHNFISSGDLSLCTINHHLSEIPCKAFSLSNNLLSIELPNEGGLTNCLDQIMNKKMKTKDNSVHFQQNTKLLTVKVSQVDKIKSHISPLSTAVAGTWCHPDKNICPSSLASYLVDRGMQVQGKTIVLDMHTQHRLQVPTMEKDPYCDWDAEYIANVEEWLGGVCLQLPSDTIPAPSPCIPVEMMTCMQASGLFTSTTILNMVSTITMSLSSMPWASVSVIGPRHATVFRGKKCLETSDRVITIIITRQGDWVIRGSRTVDFSNYKPSKYA